MIRTITETIQDETKKWLIAAGVAEGVVVLDRTIQPEFGEYTTNAAMRCAKILGRSPFEIAEALAAFLRQQGIGGLADAVAVKPGFVNFYLTIEAKVQHLSTIRGEDTDFGKNNYHAGEKWVVEYISPNPNKAMHLGHLRNALVGAGIIELLKASGATVVSDTVYNNRGIAIAKVMYGYLAHMKQAANIPTDVAYWVEHQSEWFTPEEKNLKPDLFVTECYVLGERDIQANPEIDQFVRQLVVVWEAGDTTVWKLWRYVLTLAYTGIDRTLSRLGTTWDKVWYEHEHYQKGKDYVEKGLQAGIFRQLADGAVLTNLEETYGLTDTVLLKNDGTSLYITQDIALTDLKKKTYEADKLIWVIGPEQSLAMKQLFAVCEQLGIGKRTDFTHVPYGYVGLRDEFGAFKKMASRAGTVVLIDDVLDEVKLNIKKRFTEEGKHDEATAEILGEKLALAAVKFAFLRSDREQGMTFDVEQSVDIHGDSGVYVLYAYVRTKSIWRKVGNPKEISYIAPTVLGEEADLLRTLLYFEGVVTKATADLSVHHIAQYLLELSSEFNRWYARETVLDGSDQEQYKLAIVAAVGTVLENGLSLLGIETVEEI
ncbi:arginine--tRNA ligase [Candidatus Kaiserbacteria bacterium]|nr:arginine--tRNA ligase [Candidatus Kaiserbacteria bacterium]NCT02253.1 arginine--tRNA ligase [Candidatus Parcubacteria bacterium]